MRFKPREDADLQGDILFSYQANSRTKGSSAA